ncbi:MAG TPA: glycosyltransferase, partial [Planctomycetaceae bacterium]|nr:glycosyltransferase [Planctomycetaceae bacterium]
DDGSIDDSMSVINRYAERDSRVRVYRNERNMGVVFTLNRALQLARSEYCYGSAADDRVRPGFFEKALRLLAQNPEAGICFGYGSEFDSESGRVSEYPIRLTEKPCFLPPDELAASWARIARPGHSVTVPGNSAIWKRTEFLRAGGYRDDLRWHSDWFALQVVALRNGACFIPESLVYTRMERMSYSQAGQRLWDQQSKVLARLLQLVKSSEFRDVLPRFQQGYLFSQFAPWIVRVVVSRPEHWDRDSAMLIENSLLDDFRTFLLNGNPLVRQGTAFCLGEIGTPARRTVSSLARLLSDLPEVATTAQEAVLKIQGQFPGNLQILRYRSLNAIRRGLKGAASPLRNFAARAYRRINYKLYGRIERLEACLAEMVVDHREQQKRLFQELQELQQLLEEQNRANVPLAEEVAAEDVASIQPVGDAA